MLGSRSPPSCLRVRRRAAPRPGLAPRRPLLNAPLRVLGPRVLTHGSELRSDACSCQLLWTRRPRGTALLSRFLEGSERLWDTWPWCLALWVQDPCSLSPSLQFFPEAPGSESERCLLPTQALGPCLGPTLPAYIPGLPRACRSESSWPLERKPPGAGTTSIWLHSHQHASKLGLKGRSESGA